MNNLLLRLKWSIRQSRAYLTHQYRYTVITRKMSEHDFYIQAMTLTSLYSSYDCFTVSLVVSNKNIEVSDDNLGIFYENLMVSNESLWVIDPITNLGSSMKCSGFTKKYVVSYKKLRISAEKLGVSQWNLWVSNEMVKGGLLQYSKDDFFPVS